MIIKVVNCNKKNLNSKKKQNTLKFKNIADKIELKDVEFLFLFKGNGCETFTEILQKKKNDFCKERLDVCIN